MTIKDGFIYYDLEDQTSILTDEQLGRLLRAMFAYEKRGQEPDFKKEPILSTCFNFVKVILDVNTRKYVERCKKNAENGKKGGRPKIEVDLTVKKKKGKGKVKE